MSTCATRKSGHPTLAEHAEIENLSGAFNALQAHAKEAGVAYRVLLEEVIKEYLKGGAAMVEVRRRARRRMG